MAATTPLPVQLGILTQKCYNTLLVDMNLFDPDCLKLLISKGLGYAIIAGALLVKIPQIAKVLKARSVEGLQLSMFLLELIGYVISLAYGYLKGFPFSTYGEVGFILIQNYVIIALMYAYTSGIGLQFIALTITLFGSLAAMCLNYVPMTIMEQLQFSTILIFAASKVPQAWTNFKTKSTGKLALITFLLNFAGSMARIFTTLQEVNDPIVLAGYVSGAFLNGLILFQILYYGDAGAKKTQKTTVTPSKAAKKID